MKPEVSVHARGMAAPLLSAVVCTGKHNTNPTHAAAVVGGSGSEDVVGRK